MTALRKIGIVTACLLVLAAFCWPSAAEAQGTCSPFSSLTPVNLQSLQLNGAAAFSGQGVTLVSGQPGVAGSAWLPQPIPLAGGVAAKFIVQTRMAPSAILPPDGFAIVLQNQSPIALGGANGGLGDAGLLNSLAVQFPSSTPLQVSVVQSSSTVALGSPALQPLGTGSIPQTIFDGNAHTIQVSLVPALPSANGPTMVLTVEVDGAVVVSGPVISLGTAATFPASGTVDAGSVYLGVTSSDGEFSVGTVSVDQVETVVGATGGISGRLVDAVILAPGDAGDVPNPGWLTGTTVVQTTEVGNQVHPSLAPIPVDETVPMLVQVLDACGNPYPYPVTAQATITALDADHPPGSAPLVYTYPSPLPQLSTGDGFYLGNGISLFWILEPAGDWSLSVTVSGLPIAGSPFNTQNGALYNPNGPQTAQVAASAGVSAGIVTASATLSTAVSVPIAGAALQFAFPDGSVVPATTNANGQATAMDSLPSTVGTYTVTVTFAGNALYLPATASAIFQVDTLTACQDAVTTATATITSQGQMITTLQGQLSTANATIAAQAQNLATLQTQLTAAQATITSQGQTITSLQTQSSSLTTQVQQLQSANQTLTATNASLQSQLNTANATTATQQAQLMAAQVTIAALQAQIVALTQALQATFSNPSFVIPGNTPQQQLQNLVVAIGNLNHGQQQALYKNLGGH